MISYNALVPDNLSSLSGNDAIQAWRDHADEIAAIEHQNISGRTPEYTGTLDASLTEVLNPDNQTIAQVYTDPDVQLSGPWERVYAQYQEGPPLGVSTYTNGPRQYVYGAFTEDLEEIQAWAQTTAQGGVNQMVSSVGQQQIGP